MNILIDKNISQSQLSDFHRISLDDQSNHDKKNNSFFSSRFTQWLDLIKRWKHASIPEVCKHTHRSLLLSNSEKKQGLIFLHFLE
jgi:hypothetical protein